MALRKAYEKARQHKLLICVTIVFAVSFVLIALFLSYLVFTYPVNQISQYGITNTTEKANLINQYRTTSIQFISTLAQILGGIVVGIGIYFAWGNLTIAREGQITERFTRAIDQLGAIDQSGNPAIEIRLGGIYALERIANESEKDYWPIMEILTAYVRKNSPNPEGENTDVEGIKKQNDISLDIQAILTVIGKRKYFSGSGVSNRLNLKRTYLRRADLIGSHLEGAYIRGAYLEKAYLMESHLEGAYLEGAYLMEARLEGAHLEGAYLMKANLEGAVFMGARLEGADFQWANLKGTNFQEANLQGTYLRDAHLEDAIFTSAHLEKAVLADSNLIGAHLEKAILTDAHLESANLKRTHIQFTHLKGAHLEWSNLEGANLSEANLEGAYLEGAENLTINQLSEVKTLYNAKLDEELLIPLKEKCPALFEAPDLNALEDQE
jgi:uncharacterized protein YjbI with pentapeptide repeats